MKELYFLSILDGLNNFLNVIGVISGVLGGFAVLIYLAFAVFENEKYNTVKCWGIGLCLASCLFNLINVFTPTTNQALMICGVGTVVDYVQTNEDIQKLPDKCIQALDLWVDNCIEEQQKE